jgi:hypothetical protein
VFNDAWHGMDCARVPNDHDHKSAYFQALRSAIFILDPGDAIRIKQVTERRGQQWAHYLAWNFRYIAARCRRETPPSEIVFHRVKAVFDFFSDKKDEDTGKSLFYELAQQKIAGVLDEFREACFADMHGYSFYARKLNDDGTEAFDNDGLSLY